MPNVSRCTTSDFICKCSTKQLFRRILISPAEHYEMSALLQTQESYLCASKHCLRLGFSPGSLEFGLWNCDCLVIHRLQSLCLSWSRKPSLSDWSSWLLPGWQLLLPKHVNFASKSTFQCLRNFGCDFQEFKTRFVALLMLLFYLLLCIDFLFYVWVSDFQILKT